MLNISMVGIDYHTASVCERELFSFTRSTQTAFSEEFQLHYPDAGCIILSTCNRTELWFHNLPECPLRVFFSFWRKIHPIEDSKYEPLFTKRFEEDAVSYLFELACGMHSQIFGEDQILTQVKNALSASRELSSSDSVLETLFRSAITSAKKIKTEAKLTARDQSVPEGAAALLERQYGPLAGKSCMVIGNGEMGRLMTQLLIQRGCKVSMTLRQYKKHDAIIPKECEVILYDSRYEYLENMDFIFSATVSPHYTLKAEKTIPRLKKDRIYVMADLAVPRDIDPDIGSAPNASLYDMDRLGIQGSCSEAELTLAYHIIEEHKEEFYSWYFFRDWIPDLNYTSKAAGLLTNQKLTKVYKEISGEIEDISSLQASIEQAVEKSVSKILFGLKDYLPKDKWGDCITALKESARESS